MSAFNLTLVGSRMSQRGMLLLAGLPVPAIAVTPLSIPELALLAVALMLFYWHWYTVLQQLKRSTMLTLADNAEIYWFNSDLPSGRLLSGGLVSQHMLRLNWLAASGQRKYCKWVFADQCDDAQFRALARAISQQNWLSGSSAHTSG